jgi:hypothetical protein
MMRFILPFAAALLSSNPAAAQITTTPAVRTAPTLRMDTESAAAGRVWVTQFLQLPARYVGDPWEAPAHAATRVAHYPEIRLNAVNPNAATTNIRVSCRDADGRVVVNRAPVATPAMGAQSVSLGSSDFDNGWIWCEVRADRPILVSGAFFVREAFGGATGAPANVYRETLAPIEVWLLER